jgi:hypothetical protein
LIRNMLKTRTTTVSTESMPSIRKQLKEFTGNTQMRLEKKMTKLMVKCTLAEEQLARLQEFVLSNLLDYQEEIARLRQTTHNKTTAA